jgi:hypothetical protein
VTTIESAEKVDDLDIFFNELIQLPEEDLEQVVGGGFCGGFCMCKTK